MCSTRCRRNSVDVWCLNESNLGNLLVLLITRYVSRPLLLPLLPNSPAIAILNLPSLAKAVCSSFSSLPLLFLSFPLQLFSRLASPRLSHRRLELARAIIASVNAWSAAIQVKFNMHFLNYLVINVYFSI